jgi:hypothetical protein
MLNKTELRRATEQAFVAAQVAGQNRNLEYALAIKQVIADKFPTPVRVVRPSGRIWLPGHEMFFVEQS